MSNKTARILSKIGLFLVAIGFFMPFTLKANVFGILDDLSRMSSWLGIDISSYKFLVYLAFVSSVVGVILLCLLFAGKTMRFIVDWSVVLVTNGSILILLIRLTNLAEKYIGGRSSGLKDIIGDNLQIGAYCIIIGLISSLVFVLIASKDTPLINKIGYSPNKKCPFCANVIKMEAIVCQFCGRDLPITNHSKETDEIPQDVLDVLLKDQVIVEEAKILKMLHGKKVCDSFLIEKAERLGLLN